MVCSVKYDHFQQAVSHLIALNDSRIAAHPLSSSPSNYLSVTFLCRNTTLDLIHEDPAAFGMIWLGLSEISDLLENYSVNNPLHRPIGL